MEPFLRLTAAAVPLDIANVDTDQIIPARFLGRPRENGLGDVLFHDLRFAEDGTPRGFVLDRAAGVWIAGSCSFGRAPPYASSKVKAP